MRIPTGYRQSSYSRNGITVGRLPEDKVDPNVDLGVGPLEWSDWDDPTGKR